MLDDEIALLVAPEPAAFAAGISDLLADPARRTRLAAAAVERARTRYSRESYVSRTHAAIERLGAGLVRA